MFRLALSDAESFHSLVAMGQAIRESTQQQDALRYVPSPQVLHHKGIALRMLQQRLDGSSSIDESVLLTILNLLTLEVCASSPMFAYARTSN